MIARYRLTTLLFMTCCLLAPLSVTHAAKETYSLSSGVYYGSGDYGSSNTTEIWYVPIIAQYKNGPWKLKLTVPYLRIKGPGNVLFLEGPTGPTTTTEITTNDGLGDVIATASFRFYENHASKFYAAVTGKVKIPTADEDKGLGSGETDYYLHVNLTKVIDKFTVFGHLGHKWYGDTSTTNYHNVFYGSLGGQYKFTDKTSAGLIGSYREKSLDKNDPRRSIMAFVGHKFDKSWSAQIYAIHGLSDSVADWSGGVLIKRTFGQK